jgi:hypothetical protein
MKKFILLALCLSVSNFTVNAAPKVSDSNLSKSELCDFAIQALAELIKQSPEQAKTQAITKEQCMAISDDDINKAAQKMMEQESKKK